MKVISGSRKLDHITHILNFEGGSKIKSLVADKNVVKIFQILKVSGAPEEMKNVLASRREVAT